MTNNNDKRWVIMGNADDGTFKAFCNASTYEKCQDDVETFNRSISDIDRKRINLQIIEVAS